jgi:hypothetical protein
MDTVPTLDLKLDRPLAVFDIESTGTNPRTDRMVELAIIKIMPDGQRLERIDRINPQMPIPPGAIAVHGITDEDVAECLPFDDIAADVEEFLTDCDLGGYNLRRSSFEHGSASAPTVDASSTRNASSTRMSRAISLQHWPSTAIANTTGRMERWPMPMQRCASCRDNSSTTLNCRTIWKSWTFTVIRAIATGLIAWGA